MSHYPAGHPAGPASSEGGDPNPARPPVSAGPASSEGGDPNPARPSVSAGGRAHLALVGPTASGKSALALELARQLGDVELVTVDSMQVYRGMDIGTAKPSRADQAEVPHHLLDLADPGEGWSVTAWAGHARRAIAAIEEQGKRALLVGGTGLYFQAIVDGLTPPGRYPEIAVALEGEADTAALYRRLAELDPAAAARMEPTNRRRVLRALEVCVGSGRPFSSFGPGLRAYPQTTWRIAGLWLPRAVLAARIGTRLREMVAAGLVEETAALRARPGGLSRTARQALGYREVLAHLDGETTLDEAVEVAERRTRAFSRRQRMWWRRDPRIAWYGTTDNPLAVSAQILGDWSRS